MENKVTIDPILNILYGSFYITGFYQLLGKAQIVFDEKPFKELSYENRLMVLSFILTQGNGQQTKYVLSFNDSYNINPDLYEWCDIYGSVNANFALTPPEYHKKLISLAPSFGVKTWNFPETIYYALTNLWKAKETSLNIRKFMGKYKRMYSLRDCLMSIMKRHHNILLLMKSLMYFI